MASRGEVVVQDPHIYGTDPTQEACAIIYFDTGSCRLHGCHPAAPARSYEIGIRSDLEGLDHELGML